MSEKITSTELQQDDQKRGNAAPQSSPPNEGSLQSLVRAQSLIQLALLLPVATVLGWAIGVGLDYWLKLHWIYIVGILLGAASGFVQIFRVVSKINKE